MLCRPLYSTATHDLQPVSGSRYPPSPSPHQPARPRRGLFLGYVSSPTILARLPDGPPLMILSWFGRPDRTLRSRASAAGRSPNPCAPTRGPKLLLLLLWLRCLRGLPAIPLPLASPCRPNQCPHARIPGRIVPA